MGSAHSKPRRKSPKKSAPRKSQISYPRPQPNSKPLHAYGYSHPPPPRPSHPHPPPRPHRPPPPPPQPKSKSKPIPRIQPVPTSRPKLVPASVHNRRSEAAQISHALPPRTSSKGWALRSKQPQQAPPQRPRVSALRKSEIAHFARAPPTGPVSPLHPKPARTPALRRSEAVMFAHAMPGYGVPHAVAPPRGPSRRNEPLSTEEAVAFAQATGGMGVGGLWAREPSVQEIHRYARRPLPAVPGAGAVPVPVPRRR